MDLTESIVTKLSKELGLKEKLKFEQIKQR